MLTEKLKAAILSNSLSRGIAQFGYMIYSILSNRSIKTITFSPPGHFYSPLPDLKEIRSRSDQIFSKKESLAGIELRTSDQLKLLQTFKNYYADMCLSPQPISGSRYYSDNRYFGEGDAIVLYCFMKHFRPRRVIEIGSGFSSALILDVNEKSFENSLELTFVEPHNDRLLSLLSEHDRKRCTLIEAPVQTIPLDTFTELEANDILFIDSSHVVKVGSDVVHALLEILPLLKPGVIIHFHDVLWPFEYPETWVMQGISWNEAYFLRAFLSFNDSFEILYFNSYIAECFREDFDKSFSCDIKNAGGSIWLKKTI